MKFSKIKYYHWIIFTLSIITTVSTIFYIKNNLYLFEFNVIKSTPIINNSLSFYYDVNNDGKIENIGLNVHKDINQLNYSILIMNEDNLISRQFNLYGMSKLRWLYFSNYNDDNYKDLFVFTQKNDSVFLSLFDIKNDLEILKNKFITSKPDSAKKDFWDISIIPITLVKNNQDKELIFSIVAGYSVYPRTVYLYDLENDKIKYNFETSSSINNHFLLYDLEKKENQIVLLGDATGNTSNKTNFHDQTSWLFVLDKNINLLFTPKNFGIYPSSKVVLAEQFFNSHKNILLVENFKSDTLNYSNIFLIDKKGDIIKSKNFKNEVVDNLFNPNDNANEFGIFLSSGKIKYSNIDLEITSSKTPQFLAKFIEPFSIIYEFDNLFENERSYLITAKNNYLIFTDNNFNILGNINIEDNLDFNNRPFHITTHFDQITQQTLIQIIGLKNIYEIEHKKNFIYKNAFLFGFLLLIVLTVSQLGIYKLFIVVSTYFTYFRYSLSKTSKGIALLSPNKKILYSNDNFSKYLNFDGPIKKGFYVKKLFKENDSILSAINNSYNSKHKIEEEIQISSNNFQFEGNLSITPFNSFLGNTYAYLLEVSDYTEPLLTDRGKVWGATLQRIAHEIKTPLSTIILSLANLKKRINSSDNDINEEIHRIQTELEHMKNLTKNFLLFSNYEKQKNDKVSIYNILEDSIKKFDSYFKNNMEIEFECGNFFVEADKTQLSQLFPLIIENSIDACGKEGKIKIEVNPDLQMNNGDYKFIKISISDNGKGMNEETMQKIFVPYFSTKEDGTGMGLALVKKIIEDNNGKIEVESKLNVGTIIHVYLLNYRK